MCHILFMYMQRFSFQLIWARHTTNRSGSTDTWCIACREVKLERILPRIVEWLPRLDAKSLYIVLSEFKWSTLFASFVAEFQLFMNIFYTFFIGRFSFEILVHCTCIQGLTKLFIEVLAALIRDSSTVLGACKEFPCAGQKDIPNSEWTLFVFEYSHAHTSWGKFRFQRTDEIKNMKIWKQEYSVIYRMGMYFVYRRKI